MARRNPPVVCPLHHHVADIDYKDIRYLLYINPVAGAAFNLEARMLVD